MITGLLFQVKIKLAQQTTEAKKIKNTNKNLRETVKFINSLAIAKGILQPVKCQYCPKIFRQMNYLESHINRKHKFENESNGQNDANDKKEDNLDQLLKTKWTDQSIEKGEPHLSPIDANDALEKKETNNGSHEGDNFAQVTDISFSDERTKNMKEKYEALNNKFTKMMESFAEQKTEWKNERELNEKELERVIAEKFAMTEKFNREIQELRDRLSEVEPKKLLDAQPVLADNNTLQQLKEETVNRTRDEIKSPSSNGSISRVLDQRAKLIADRFKLNDFNDELDSDTQTDADFVSKELLSSITENSTEEDLDCSSIKDEIAPTLRLHEKECQNGSEENIRNLNEGSLKRGEVKNITSLSFKERNIPPVPAKRSFMNSVPKLLSKHTQDSSQVNLKENKKELVRKSLVDDNSSGDVLPKLVGIAGEISDMKKEVSVKIENPEVWNELRRGTEEVLEQKMYNLGLHDYSCIDNKTFNKVLKTLHSQRKSIKKRYSNSKKISESILFDLEKRMAQKLSIPGKENKINSKQEGASHATTVDSNLAKPRIKTPIVRQIEMKNKNDSTVEKMNGTYEERSYSSDDDNDVIPILITKPAIQCHDEDTDTRQVIKSLQSREDLSRALLSPLPNKTEDSYESGSESTSEEEDNSVTNSVEDLPRHPPNRSTTDGGGMYAGTSDLSDEESVSVSQYYRSQEEYERHAYRNIKLRQPTGERVLKLKESIEQQLQRRQSRKMAGAVDTVAEEGEGGSSTEEGV